jgi:hypothetical protein
MLFANEKACRYDLRVGKTVYTIEEFPDDDRFWRIEWGSIAKFGTQMWRAKECKSGDPS